MKEEVQVLIKYRLERSHEALDEARMLLEQKHTNTYINRVRHTLLKYCGKFIRSDY